MNIGRPKDSKSHPKFDNQKWCYKCQQYKHVDEFYSYKLRYDGLTTRCKSCHNDPLYQKQYYQKNKERLLPLHRESATRSYYSRKVGVKEGNDA